MALTFRELETIERALTPSPAQEAPVSVQIARGLVSPLTLGMYRPFPEKEYGPGGIPETLASFAGTALPIGLGVRAAGTAAAAAGRFAPSLLSEAARRMAPTLAESASRAATQVAGTPGLFIPKMDPLSNLGKMAAWGGGMAAADIAHGVFDETPRTPTERLLSPLAAAAIGGGLQGIVGRIGAKATSEAGRLAGTEGGTSTSAREALERIFVGPGGAGPKLAETVEGTPQLRPPGLFKESVVGETLTPVPDIPSMETPHVQARLREAGLSRGQVQMAVKMLQQGKGQMVPDRVGNIARELTGDPLPSISGGVGPVVPRYGDPGYTVASGGFSGRFDKLASTPGFGWLRQVLPPSMTLGDTEARALPYVMERSRMERHRIVEELRERLQPVLAWSTNTKAKVQELFFKHMSDDPTVLDAHIVRAVPEAREALPVLRGVLEDIRQYYVAEGLLGPDQKFSNYFPVVRELLEAKMGKTLLIEKGEGYYSKNIDNLITSKIPAFVKPRELRGPEDFPRKIGFDETLGLYLNQYGQTKSIRAVKDEVNDLLTVMPDHLKEYSRDLVNFWLGRSEHRLSDWNRVLRNYNFARTIGGSLLSPLVNTLQRINTFALVSKDAFFGAFEDMGNPTLQPLLKQAGLDVLGKVGIELERPIGSETGKFAQDMATRLGRLFSRSERANQSHAFFAGLREAQIRGIEDPQKQIDFARQIVKETQFIYSPADLPPWFRSGTGRLIGQFQTFRLNQFRFMNRLLDEAVQGLSTGHPERAIPFLKFWTPTAAIGGPFYTLLGESGEEKATRNYWGKATRAEGLPELLFGVSLASQMGIGAIGTDDLQSFLFFLPGPTVGLAQSLIGAGLGFSAGRGASFGRAGREIPFEERFRLGIQTLPAGVELGRLAQVAKLVQNRGEFREALDALEAVGMKPASGALLAATRAAPGQILAQTAGIPVAGRLTEARTLERQRDMEADLSRTQERAATYAVAGQWDRAQTILDQFNHKYGDQLPSNVVLSQDALVAAAKRRMLPPGQRKLPPEMLRGAEPFLGPPRSLFVPE